MNRFTNIWPKILAAHDALAGAMPPQARDEFADLAAEFGTSPGHIFHFVYVVENFDPHALSVTAYQRRDPFDTPQVVQAHLDRWLTVGWLTTAVSPHTYRITPTGHDIRRQRWQIANKYMAQVAETQSVEWDALSSLLERVVQSVKETAVSPTHHNFNTRDTFGLKPPLPITKPMQFIERRMDLGAYRDDVHLAAWREMAKKMSPSEWETMTLIWRETAVARTWGDNLAQRGYEKDDYAKAVRALRQKELLTNAGTNQLTLTESGRSMREAAEKITDASFYAPWHILTEPELTILCQQLDLLV
jgi:hypothetical protein